MLSAYRQRQRPIHEAFTTDRSGSTVCPLHALATCRCGRAFTLTGLLIVISVIALPLALPFPALGTHAGTQHMAGASAANRCGWVIRPRQPPPEPAPAQAPPGA